MKLHVLGLPHTQTLPKFSHCAFTQKIVKFIPMMRAQGFEVVHYGVGAVNPGANEHIEILTGAEQEELLGHAHDDPTAFVGNDANVGHVVYQTFNQRLREWLDVRVMPEDIVCLPFGHGHEAGVSQHRGLNLESGVGYPICFTPFRVYESNAWAAWHAGQDKEPGSDYQWVIPNYFNTAEWPLATGARKYLVYFGRLLDIKGLSIVKAIAEARPDLDVLMCGQGDPSPWLDAKVPNLHYIPPMVGTERAALLGGAIALLAPSRYIEPFCGVTVEANLCGTPALTSDFGAFRETIQSGVNGYRCHTLGDWLAAVRWAEARTYVHHTAIHLLATRTYSLDAVGPQYTAVFAQLADLRTEGQPGWYSRRSALNSLAGTDRAA